MPIYEYSEGKDFENMISINEYKQNPCGALSIPYWKAEKMSIPENIKIVHNNILSLPLFTAGDLIISVFFCRLISYKVINSARCASERNVENCELNVEVIHFNIYGVMPFARAFDKFAC